MANQLDETDMSTVSQGQDTHVIAKKIPVELDGMDRFVNVAVWFIFIIGGVVYQFKKAHALTYFQQLEQKIQHDASTIDNYQRQRVTILTNTAKLVDKAVQLDKETFADIAKYRSGNALSDEDRNELATKINNAEHAINVAVEAYPDLKAHQEIADAIQQNSYLQQEVTAAREVYNDEVNRWNSQIFERWAKKYAAAKAGFTTRIPFAVASDVKQQSDEGVFF